MERNRKTITGTIPDYSYVPDGEYCAAVIRLVGLAGLGGFDGCVCAHLEIAGINVEVSCRKSDGAKPKDFYGIMLRVHSGYLGGALSQLEVVAKECSSQLQGNGLPIMVRYCDFSHDKESKCVYCDKKRDAEEDYLCAECKVKRESFGGAIAESYDYSQIEFKGVSDKES